MTDRRNRSRRRTCRERRGSSLILTVLGCLLIAVIGLTTLSASRVRLRRSGAELDTYRATLHAQGAIDLAMREIVHNPDWRADADADLWNTDIPIGTGAYRFEIIDPIDGDLTDSALDPIVIEATGIEGDARQRMRARLNVNVPPLDCLRSSMHANGEIMLDGVEINSDHWLTANGSIVADADGGFNSIVNADVTAAETVEAKSGSVFNGKTVLNVDWPMSAPDPSSVFDYYLAHGTPISIADIPTWDQNLLVNPSMELDPPAIGWFGAGGCTLTVDTAMKADGTRSLKASARTSPTDGPAQDLSDTLTNSLPYIVTVKVGSVNVDKIDGRVVIEYESSIDGPQVWASAWTQFPAGKFTTIASTDNPFDPTAFVPTWNGTLLSATLRIETSTSLDDIRLDATSLVEISPYGFVRAIHRRVLSPNHNPFGSGETNPEGIYIIDCMGGILSIQRSRIEGTLVVLNTHGQGMFVWSVVNWSPAVANYPAILCDGPVNFWLGNDGARQLDESSANVNYNPIGAPFRGDTDTDKTDTYGSLMRGIVYSSDEIRLKYWPDLEGVLVCEGDIITQANETGQRSVLNVTYLERFAKHPPPGFQMPFEFALVPGSLHRLVD